MSIVCDVGAVAGGATIRHGLYVHGGNTIVNGGLNITKHGMTIANGGANIYSATANSSVLTVRQTDDNLK